MNGERVAVDSLKLYFRNQNITDVCSQNMNIVLLWIGLLRYIAFLDSSGLFNHPPSPRTSHPARSATNMYILLGNCYLVHRFWP